jgi:hypothetical protein
LQQRQQQLPGVKQRRPRPVTGSSRVKAKLDANRIKREIDADRSSISHLDQSSIAWLDRSPGQKLLEQHPETTPSNKPSPSWFVFALGARGSSPRAKFSMVGPLQQHLLQYPSIVQQLLWRTPKLLDSLLQSDREFCNFVRTELNSQGQFIETDPRVFDRALQTVARAQPSTFANLLSQSMDKKPFLLSQAIRTQPTILARALLAGAQKADLTKDGQDYEGTLLADATELSAECIRLLGELLVEQPAILNQMFAHHDKTDANKQEKNENGPQLRERLVQAFGQQLLKDAASNKTKPKATAATDEQDTGFSPDTSSTIAVSKLVTSPASSSLVCDLLRLEPRTLLRVLQSPVGVSCGRAILRGDPKLLYEWVRSGCAELGAHFVLQNWGHVSRAFSAAEWVVFMRSTVERHPYALAELLRCVHNPSDPFAMAAPATVEGASFTILNSPYSRTYASNVQPAAVQMTRRRQQAQTSGLQGLSTRWLLAEVRWRREHWCSCCHICCRA